MKKPAITIKSEKVFTEEPDQEKEKDIILDEILMFIANQYDPVSDYVEADFTATTQEIYTRIAQLHPGSFSQHDVFTSLKQLGFTYKDLGEMNFLWLFKEQV